MVQDQVHAKAKANRIGLKAMAKDYHLWAAHLVQFYTRKIDAIMPTDSKHHCSHDVYSAVKIEYVLQYPS